MNRISMQQTINNKRGKVDCTRVRDMFLLGFTIANIESPFELRGNRCLARSRESGSGRAGKRRNWRSSELQILLLYLRP